MLLKRSLDHAEGVEAEFLAALHGGGHVALDLIEQSHIEDQSIKGFEAGSSLGLFDDRRLPVEVHDVDVCGGAIPICRSIDIAWPR
jgi:hypothetical protein